MCKIDLPRKNMVIERERAEGEQRKGGCRESECARAHTLAHTCTNETCTELHECTPSYAGKSTGKSAGLDGMKGKKKKRKKLFLLLTSSPSH